MTFSMTKKTILQRKKESNPNRSRKRGDFAYKSTSWVKNYDEFRKASVARQFQFVWYCLVKQTNHSSTRFCIGTSSGMPFWASSSSSCLPHHEVPTWGVVFGSRFWWYIWSKQLDSVAVNSEVPQHWLSLLLKLQEVLLVLRPLAIQSLKTGGMQ